ncbi:protein FAM210B, mitochondrial [Pseudophryne corroboree]|uniref:protein FAM210B, mitochondrial n=1 Tax=Pseudophryne corroboree TaxID=495146 RepID=UPI003081FF67
MLALPGLLLRRGSMLRPGLLGQRWVCTVAVRLQFVREAGAVRPSSYSLFRFPTATRTIAVGRHMSQSNTGKETGVSSDIDGNKPNKTQQLKRVFKEYGGVAVAFHVGISLVSLGIFYVLVSSGLDVSTLLLKVGFSETVVQSKLAAGTSTFVLAYAIHKLFAPVRISITVVSVPFLVRYFRKIGFFKPPSQT